MKADILTMTRLVERVGGFASRVDELTGSYHVPVICYPSTSAKSEDGGWGGGLVAQPFNEAPFQLRANVAQISICGLHAVITLVRSVL